MFNIEKAVTTKEPRFMSRALRATITIRRKLNPNVIRKAVHQYFPHAELPIGSSAALLEFLDECVSERKKFRRTKQDTITVYLYDHYTVLFTSLWKPMLLHLDQDRESHFCRKEKSTYIFFCFSISLISRNTNMFVMTFFSCFFFNIPA